MSVGLSENVLATFENVIPKFRSLVGKVIAPIYFRDDTPVRESSLDSHGQNKKNRSLSVIAFLQINIFHSETSEETQSMDHFLSSTERKFYRVSRILMRFQA